MFWCEIGSGFGEPGGTPLPKIPRSIPPGYRALKALKGSERKPSLGALVISRRDVDIDSVRFIMFPTESQQRIYGNFQETSHATRVQ